MCRRESRNILILALPPWPRFAKEKKEWLQNKNILHVFSVLLSWWFPLSLSEHAIAMSFFSTLRRSSLFTQRFRSHFSTSQPPSSAPPLPNANPRRPNPKWASAFVVVGSALALLYYFSSTPNSHNDSPRTSSSSPPLFRKLSLPESTHHLLFGGMYIYLK